MQNVEVTGCISSLPPRVKALLLASRLRCAPYELHPYDIFEGGSWQILFIEPSMELLANGRPEHGSRAHAGPIFRIPDFGRRFLRACEQIRYAIKVHMLHPRHRNKHIDRVYETLAAMRPLLRNMEERRPFTFYVAGGFVVSEILGFGEWRDVDLWFTPREADGRWMVASGCGCFPVNTIVVTDVLKTIQCFDLDICKCAIECELARSGPKFKFLLTRSCIAAYLNTCAHLGGVHTSFIQPHRMASRLLKYAERGLDVPRFDDRFVRLTTHERDRPATRLLCRGLGLDAHRACWFICIRDSLISRVAFRVLGADEADRLVQLKTSESAPVVVYPCNPFRDIARMAYAPAAAHWSVRTLADSPGLTVGIPGIGRIVSTLLKPQWLMQQRMLDHASIVQRIRDDLVRWRGADVRGGEEVYVIRCEQRVQAIDSLVDWSAWRREVRETYEDANFLWMEPPCHGTLDSVMLCCEELQPVTSCTHNRHTRLWQC